MIIVSDSSILIHLAMIGRFHVLRKIFKKILIPKEVYVEVVEKGWGLPGSLETAEAVNEGWITSQVVVGKKKVIEISGEYKINYANAEVVQLARELNAETVLADEEEVRSACQHLGFNVKGCLGIILEAVRKRLISAGNAKDDADKLIKSGYRIDKLNLKYFQEALGRISKK